MGGFGSGRPELYPYTTGDALFLRVREVLGSCVPAGIISWNRGGDPAGSVTVRVGQPYEGMPNGWGWARDVAVEWREREGESWEARSAALCLVSRPQPFGGVRWRWECPHCRTRREMLYKVWRSRWACRGCLRLTYQTRRDPAWIRAGRRLEKLGRRLGLAPGEAEDWGAEVPDRPPRMRWWTYERLAEQWDVASERGNAAGWGMILRLMGNSPGGINE